MCYIQFRKLMFNEKEICSFYFSVLLQFIYLFFTKEDIMQAKDCHIVGRQLLLLVFLKRNNKNCSLFIVRRRGLIISFFLPVLNTGYMEIPFGSDKFNYLLVCSNMSLLHNHLEFIY